MASLAGVIEDAMAVESLTAGDLATRSQWLRSLGDDDQIMIRVLDAHGAVLHDTHPDKKRRWSGVSAWYYDAGDFFFGPAGPPDLLALEKTLPVERDRPEVKAALAGNTASKRRTDDDRRMQVFYRAQPIRNGGGAVYLTYMTRRNILALYDVRYQLLKLTIVLALVAGVIGIWLGRRFVSPVMRMQKRVRAYLEQTETATGGDAEQLSLARRDEIGDLSRDFRELTQRLERRAQRGADLAADFAHDLKNPIATMAASAELLEDGGVSSPDRQQRVAAAIATAARHMNRSVDGMLELARLDHVLSATQYKRFDISATVLGVLEGYSPLFATKGIALDADIAPDLQISGIEDQVIVLVQNLVDNAALFCRQRVRVVLQRQEDSIVLVVEDDGPGVSADNRTKLFRRFFTQRPEGAAEGTGLGLAIATTIATAHGGGLEIADTSQLAGAAFHARLHALKDTDTAATEMP